jgi:hypothetical protein
MDKAQKLSKSESRAISQAVSRRLHTAAARVRAQIRSRKICGGQCGTGAGFLRVLRFPLPILIPPTVPHSSSIIRGWYNRPNSGADVPSGLSLTPPQETKKKKLSKSQCYTPSSELFIIEMWVSFLGYLTTSVSRYHSVV